MLFNSGIFQIAGYFVILLLIPSVSLKCFEGASPIIGIQKSFKSGALNFFGLCFYIVISDTESTVLLLELL